MKKLFFAFALSLALFLLGCQENSITGPAQPESNYKADTKANTSTPSPFKGSIPLEGILKVPGALNTYYTIKGAIDYSELVSSHETVAPSNLRQVTVELSASGSLNNSPISTQRLDRIPWYISSNSKEQISVSVDGVYQIVKVYPIRGRTDGMVLVCQLAITTSSVKLEGKWLSFVVNDSE